MVLTERSVLFPIMSYKILSQKIVLILLAQFRRKNEHKFKTLDVCCGLAKALHRRHVLFDCFQTVFHLDKTGNKELSSPYQNFLF